MSTTNRTSLFTKTHRALKKVYKREPPSIDDQVVHRLMFACLLEDAHHTEAERCYAKVESSFFDLNEIRVSSVRELAEAMVDLRDSLSAATRLKRVLQSVFESHYSYDLESLKKLKLGTAEKELERIQGLTPFGIAYATQTALGGHAIALDRGSLGVLYSIGAATEDEVESGNIRGMSRAISKNKGPEFFYLLHELGADFLSNPESKKVRDVILSIAPDAASRIAAQVASLTAKPETRPNNNGTARNAGPRALEKSAAVTPSNEPADEEVNTTPTTAKGSSKSIPRRKTASTTVDTSARQGRKKRKVTKKKPR